MFARRTRSLGKLRGCLQTICKRNKHVFFSITFFWNALADRVVVSVIIYSFRHQLKKFLSGDRSVVSTLVDLAVIWATLKSY